MNRKSFAMGNSMANGNGPRDVDWARELMIRDETTWTLTIGQAPA